MSVRKDTTFEESDKQVVLAKKTLENLQVITTAEMILKEKFDDNPNEWLTALFEALSLKNPTYLMEEKKANDVINGTLSNKFDDSFWHTENYSDITATSYELIKGFKKFMVGLNKNADVFCSENWAADLKEIETSIRSYLRLSNIGQNGMRSEFGDKSIFEQTIDAEEKETARKPDMSRLCAECNTKIVIFNNDIEFSYQLHCQESLHKKAIAKLTSKTVEQTTKVFEKRRPETEMLTHEDMFSLRKTLQEGLKHHSRFIRILSKRDFYCDLCNCAISSLQNVESHVEGSKHTTAWKTRIGRSSVSSDDFLMVDPSHIPIAKLIN